MSRRRRISKARHSNYNVVKPLVIVVGDGETEKSFFKSLNEIEYFTNARIKFVIGNENSFPSIIKEHYENKANIILIIDVDNSSEYSIKYKRIKNLIRKYHSQIVYNNYSFETWLLNHKNIFARPITDKNQYDRSIKSEFNIESWSNNKSLSNRNFLMSQINVDEINKAIINISGLKEKNWHENPSSNMHRLFEFINGI